MTATAELLVAKGIAAVAIDGPAHGDRPESDPDLQFEDDEIFPRGACLKLFDAIGSERKTLHANPGLHAAVPTVEVASSIDYIDRYLS